MASGTRYWPARVVTGASRGKFARVPELHLLARLHARNEYFINSRLPLHEAIINQTGKSEPKRRTFLNDRWNAALASRLQTSGSITLRTASSLMTLNYYQNNAQTFSTAR